jgi:hypothetical protein
MLRCIAENVKKRPPHFERRFELTRMVAVGEHAPGACKSAVNRSRNTYREALHRSAEASPVRSLDQEVHVIALDAVVNDPAAETLPCPDQSTVNRTKSAAIAEAWRVGPEL